MLFETRKMMLAVNDITVRFGDECVLERFSCEVARGEFVCISGMSGCGKTSLLKALIGFVPIKEGMIKIGGCELNEKTCSIVRKNTLYLPQELSFPCEYVNEFVMQILRVQKDAIVQKNNKELYENLHLLGLDKDILDKRLSEISGGQRQRVTLAALALLDKELWLLDEPTAALDGVSRDLVIDFLLARQREGKTIVVVSHDACFASHCTKLIRLG